MKKPSAARRQEDVLPRTSMVDPEFCQGILKKVGCKHPAELTFSLKSPALINRRANTPEQPAIERRNPDHSAKEGIFANRFN
jgi:hypothetical protein